MEKQKKPGIEVLVIDHVRKVVENAQVAITPMGGKSRKSVELRFDPSLLRFRTHEFKPDNYVIQVTARGFEPQEREVQVGPAGLKEIFIVGKTGMPFYYKRNVEVPFEPKNDLLAVAIRHDLSGTQENEIILVAEGLSLRHEEVSDDIRKNHVRVFRLTKDLKDKERQSVQERLERHPHVRRVGPIIDYDPRGLSFLTNEIIVRFKNQIAREEAKKIISGLKLEVVREIPYVPNGYLLRAPGPASYNLLKICSALVERGVVEYAEPNLFVTAILTHTPNDPKYGQQPHHPLIGSEGAWDITMGDHNILIAVMDDGCDTGHEDLTNPATAGWTKVVNQFNFTAYSSTLDDSSHGTRSCGIATAVADNSKGVAGVAPGCQLMPLEWFPSNVVTDWADAYIWISGGDPGRTAPFPSPLTKGADIISNSIAVKDFPISGIMKDAWDYVTTYGRNGRGCIVVFAAGNYNDDIATDTFTQWANYERTIAVTSCTISPPDAVERKISTSSFGDAIDICAPAGGPPGGTETRTLSTGSSNGYETHGQTSCACPQVAGTAALMLSANPDLSWVEFRQILRNTAVPIDTANTDANGIWRDVNGTPSNASGYLGPHHSRFYGHGMLDAHAAVQAAVDLVGVDPLTHIDTWIKENVTDGGNVPCPPPISPDVWVRNLSPATDNPAHINEHQSPIRGQDNWVYTNVRNRGATDSYDVYVRIMITRWAGTQYTYPIDFLPTVNPSSVPTVMAPGTYLIGEVHVGSIPAGGVITVNTKWPKELIPPATVTIGGVTYSWADSCLLVEVSPHDGPAPTGNYTWDNNNLCQRNITIVDQSPSDEDSFAIAFVVGHRLNEANLFHVNIERRHLPAEIKLFVDYIDKETTKDVLKFMDEIKERPPRPPLKPVVYRLTPVVKDRKTTFGIPTIRNTYVPVLRKKPGYQIIAIMGKGLKTLKTGVYQIDLYQEDIEGKIEGGVNFIIRKK